MKGSSGSTPATDESHAGISTPTMNVPEANMRTTAVATEPACAAAAVRDSAAAATPSAAKQPSPAKRPTAAMC